MQKNNENPNKEEFSLSSLRKNPQYSEETKGIEFGINRANFSSDYLLWSSVISLIFYVIGALIFLFYNF